MDHNIRTIDGYGTFHGMGIISASTPLSGQFVSPSVNVLRQSRRLPTAEIVKNRGIRIVHYHGTDGLATITLASVRQLRSPTVVPPVTNLNLLWHVAWFFSEPKCPRPNWSGFMQSVCTGDHNPAAVIQMLPLIDLNPSDQSCIYSTLLFVQRQAKNLNIVNPCITFDQPLWLKAVAIIQAQKLNIVCRLGGFHMLMSFLGSIGHVMGGSGLETIFQLKYGPETVSHMISGKAVARAVRCHLLIEGALMIKLLHMILPSTGVEETESLTEKPSAVTHLQLSEVGSVLDKVQKDHLSVTDCSILESEGLIMLSDCLTQLKKIVS